MVLVMGLGALMDIFTIILIAFALGIDAFSVCIGIGLCKISKRKIISLTIVVAIFHIIMPLIGMMLGNIAGSYIGKMANVFGAIVLMTIGLYYIIQYIKDVYKKRRNNLNCPVDTSILDKPFGVIILATGVSIDALAVGFGLGALGMDLLVTVTTMGIVAGLMTYGGLVIGKKLGSLVGDYAELVGGTLLVGIAIYLLF
jgi:putative Mn2+ efflux pump MntP